ncbi:Fic family protein [Bacteroidota bacterium]
MTISYRQKRILEILREKPEISISEIKENLEAEITQVTLNRDLAKLVKENWIERNGKGRAIIYHLSTKYLLFAEINIKEYFEKDINFRIGKRQFNPEIFLTLEKSDLFTIEEYQILKKLQNEYLYNINNVTPTIYQKELERLTIDLSWKSSQIEGNTYSLLETEQLLIQKIEAENKSRDEAIMLLNHKEALQHIFNKKSITATDISVSSILDIHNILIKDLKVDEGFRILPVGITGTTYIPPDDFFQIKEYMQQMCDLINSKESFFEKAFISIALISYIQPFADGNKRTARIVGNSLLVQGGLCPLSYRSVDPLDYKKATLLFYEQNNLSMFKDLFMKQCEFAVRNYFLAS